MAQIAVDVTYDPPFASNYVDAEMPVSLSRGLQMGKDRLIAVGQGGTARFRIGTSVIEDKLPQGKGIKGYLPKNKVNAIIKIIVTLDARSADGLAVGETQTVIERSITVAADASLNARDGNINLRKKYWQILIKWQKFALIWPFSGLKWLGSLLAYFQFLKFLQFVYIGILGGVRKS